jgi:hypothetical protein
VYPSGERRPFTISHDQAHAYAKEAAAAFGVGSSRTVDFDVARAKRDVVGDEKKAKAKKAAK